MPRISQMPPPAAPLSGLELIPAIQGGGSAANVGLPLLTSGPPYGGAVLALRLPMTADMSATSEEDPGAGMVRWNHATPSSATEIYVSDEDGAANDLAAVFAALSDGGYLYLQGGADSDARNNWQRWQVAAMSAESGYSKLSVSFQSSAGSFTDDDALELSVQQPVPSPGIDRNVLTTVSSASGAITYDASLGDYFRTVLDEDVDSLSIINVPQACTLGFWLVQDSTPRTFAWPSSFDWGDGESAPAVPTGSGGVLFVVISTCDYGATWDASARARG